MLVGSLIGMILLASSRHMLFFAIAFEMASLPSYVLVGFRRFNSKSAEGAAKYVIFGAVCSSLMIYGISLLYGATGSFDLQRIAQQLAANGVSSLAVVALVCLFIGLAFKISLVPMHFWCPDAFEAAGADVAAWLSVASKSAALLALARFAHLLLPSLPADVQSRAVLVLSLVAVVTMTVANLSAYWQTSVKRLLAYSSIAHAGYIVCGVLVFSNAAGMAAIVAYVLVYLLMNLGAFSVTGLIEQQTGADRIDNFTGLGSRNPKLAAAMAFFLFSLVGLPPLAGFAAKWILISTLWQHQLAFVVAAVLANTLFSLFYYMRITRAMYFNNVAPPPPGVSPAEGGWATGTIKVPGFAAIVLTVCAAGLLVLFIGWGLLNSLSLHLFGLS
jgi:NADH-quinone oxidoreductase subunit N